MQYTYQSLEKPFVISCMFGHRHETTEELTMRTKKTKIIIYYHV